jgi:quercetin dioxygenase-like cupin family protein
MEHPKVSNEEMMKRVIRFSEVRKSPIPVMFIDSPLEGHERLNYAVIGDTASENPDFEPALVAPHTFQIGMVYAEPGNGPAWHTHDYVEMFMPLKGNWTFYWGNDVDGEPEGQVEIGPWDCISLPPGLWRSFEVSKGEAEGGFIFAVLDQHEVFEGKDPYWAKSVEDAAAEVGFHADEKGKMVKPANYEEMKKALIDKLQPRMDREIPKE